MPGTEEEEKAESRVEVSSLALKQNKRPCLTKLRHGQSFTPSSSCDRLIAVGESKRGRTKKDSYLLVSRIRRE